MVAVVLEDDDAIREAVVAILNDGTVRAIGVATLAEARAALERCPSALLLADYNLGSETADVLLDELAAAGRAVPTALVSATNAGRSVAAERGLRFLAKPFDVDDLVRLVEALIEDVESARGASRRHA